MSLTIVEIASIASDEHNEDRAGFARNLVWVIDGATDVLEDQLTEAPSDASWFAKAFDDILRSELSALDAPLATFPALAAERLRMRLRRDSKRAPATPGEQPSGAAIIVRVDGAKLSYVSLGDCTLLTRDARGRLVHIGVDDDKAGDTWVRAELEKQLATAGEADAAPVRKDLWPKLRKQRDWMNHQDGYGIFSITAPPEHFIRTGEIELADGAAVMLASDGLLRLVDVFCVMTRDDLYERATTNGLGPLLDELRALERADATCRKFPRAKVRDDATGLVFCLTSQAQSPAP